MPAPPAQHLVLPPAPGLDVESLLVTIARVSGRFAQSGASCYRPLINQTNIEYLLHISKRLLWRVSTASFLNTTQTPQALTKRYCAIDAPSHKGAASTSGETRNAQTRSRSLQQKRGHSCSQQWTPILHYLPTKKQTATESLRNNQGGPRWIQRSKSEVRN